LLWEKKSFPEIIKIEARVPKEEVGGIFDCTDELTKELLSD
jgi:hypothetical protein